MCGVEAEPADLPYAFPGRRSAGAKVRIDVAEKVRRTVRELKICMFCLGAKTIAELQRIKLLKG